MKDEWKQRLNGVLAPILHEPDPRVRLGAYHDMPFAFFVYPPEDEFALRAEVALLATRLTQAGKRVTVVSLADCVAEALQAEGLGPAALAEAERSAGLQITIETVHGVLSDFQPLDALVAQRVPAEPDPRRDILFLVRAGALFALYRASSLLEQLRGQVTIPTVLFYPGVVTGPASLSALGVLDAEHNYRPRIF